MNISKKDRWIGCLFGGAIGDAIGAVFENQTSYEGFYLPEELRVTDDTQLTLATCEGLKKWSHDPLQLLADFVSHSMVTWFRQGRVRGIGASTHKALSEIQEGAHWSTPGAIGEKSAGNGCAMRIAPLAFWLSPNQKTTKSHFRDCCRITHRNDEAFCGALLVFEAIHKLRNGVPLGRDILPYLLLKIPDCICRDRLNEIIDESLTYQSLVNRYGQSGYAPDTVLAALLLGIESVDFLHSMEKMISVGGDTDTVGSIYGQLFGTAHGPSFLPMNMLERISERKMIRTISEQTFPSKAES